MELLHGFEGEFVQAGTAVRDVVNDLLAHARLPKMFQVIGNTRDCFIPRISGKEQRDLIGHVDHVFRFHG